MSLVLLLNTIFVYFWEKSSERGLTQVAASCASVHFSSFSEINGAPSSSECLCPYSEECSRTSSLLAEELFIFFCIYRFNTLLSNNDSILFYFAVRWMSNPFFTSIPSSVFLLIYTLFHFVDDPWCFPVGLDDTTLWYCDRLSKI